MKYSINEIARALKDKSRTLDEIQEQLLKEMEDKQRELKALKNGLLDIKSPLLQQETKDKIKMLESEILPYQKKLNIIKEKKEIEQTKKELAEARLHEAVEKRQTSEHEKLVYEHFKKENMDAIKYINGRRTFTDIFECWARSDYILEFSNDARVKFGFDDIDYEKLYLKALADTKKIYEADMQQEKKYKKNFLKKQAKRTASAVFWSGFIVTLDRMVNRKQKRW